MKNLLALLLCCAAVSVPAMAADWQYVDANERGVILMDHASVVRDKGLAQAWVLWDYHEVQTTLDGQSYISSKDLWQFQCTSRRKSLKYITYYVGRGGSGSVVRSITADRDDWSPVPPDTVAWDILMTACEKK